MKKLTLMAASVLTALSVYGQGTVTFNNFGNTTGGVLNELMGQAPVDRAAGVVAQLYYSLTEQGTFQAIGTPALVGFPFDSELPGLFSATDTITIPGVVPPGSPVFFQVKAWETAYGSSFEAASAAPFMNGRGALVGQVPTFSADTGNPNASPPDVPGDLGNMIPNFVVAPVPEPSVIALGLIGAGALLMLRRKK